MTNQNLLNREIYQIDPSTRKLVNEGVASVNDEKTEHALAVLRYELETFVCDGQYERGLNDILSTYLSKLNGAQQPGVWISGFFGSGKSHLVKMLRAFWVDTIFPDGATARGIANLPQTIHDNLIELTNRSKRHGGLHAVSGTLGSGARGSVRLALLRLIFKSVGLPEQYPAARFVMWLKNEEIYDQVISHIEKKGLNWEEELDQFYVSEEIHEALILEKPHIFPESSNFLEILINLYPNVTDISNDEMVKAIKSALTKDNKFPLTLVVLDEVQQYIGEDSDRSDDVREVVEACCKNIGEKLLFIGTGQTAITGTSNLKKHEGRFTVRIELSDADVETVVRKVILAKRADAVESIEQVLNTNIGEISRQLIGTSIAHRNDDIKYFAQDYPILPVRRRFWENTLRVLDQTGTDSQLRNQLSMVHKVIQTNLDKPIGHVVPADYLYFDSADKLLQSRILPRKIHERTLTWYNGSDDERIAARACGLVFLINKLGSFNKDIGIKASADSIADLMVEDLLVGSSELRGKLPKILHNCELLMKVGDEYRIQTEESSAWNDEFLRQRGMIVNEIHRLDQERDDRIKKLFAEKVGKISMNHGDSKQPREASPTFDPQLPSDCDKKIYIWVRDGWKIDENSVKADAQQAGNSSPTIFVFIPKRSADDLRHHLIEYKSAYATLENRDVPNTPEGIEARAAMETIKQTADGKIKELLEEAFDGAKVFQAGGNEILGINIAGSISEAVKNSLVRLYPEFSIADKRDWDKVYSRAKAGSLDALQVIQFHDEPKNHPVCKKILEFIGVGKQGSQVRDHFESPKYGWSGDAIDGALQILLVTGDIRALDDHGRTYDPKDLERKTIGKAIFKVESTTVTTSQRIKIRGVMHLVGIQATQGQELDFVKPFLEKLQEIASKSGGEGPKPELPDTTYIDDIRRSAGNDQLIGIFNLRDKIEVDVKEWTKKAELIEQRIPLWNKLKSLISHANNLKAVQELSVQVQQIELHRRLIDEHDYITPIIRALEDALRAELSHLYSQFIQEYQSEQEHLSNDPSWIEIDEETREEITSKCALTTMEPLQMGDYQQLITTVTIYPLESWDNRIDALKNKFSRAQKLAAKSLEPDTQIIEIPRPTLKTETEIDDWAKNVITQLKEALKKGPVIIN